MPRVVRLASDVQDFLRSMSVGTAVEVCPKLAAVILIPLNHFFLANVILITSCSWDLLKEYFKQNDI
jgi:hypothetical protein